MWGSKHTNEESHATVPGFLLTWLGRSKSFLDPGNFLPRCSFLFIAPHCFHVHTESPPSHYLRVRTWRTTPRRLWKMATFVDKALRLHFPFSPNLPLLTSEMTLKCISWSHACVRSLINLSKQPITEIFGF